MDTLKWMFLFICCAGFIVKAQDPQGNTHLEDLLQDGYSAQWIASEDQLERARANPFDINRVTDQQLASLEILSAIEIHQIIRFRDSVGNIAYLDELYRIEGINPSRIDLIKPYLQAKGSSDASPRRSQGKLDISTKLNRSFFGGQLPNYAGDLVQQTLRFQHQNGPWRLGVTAQKDPGERWLHSAKTPIPDFLSGFVQIQPRNRRLGQITLGDFQYNAGMGLQTGLGLYLFRSPQLHQNVRPAFGFRPNTSTQEALFYRGVGARLSIGKGEIDFIASANPQSINENAANPYTPLLSGLHRTSTERLRKNNATFYHAGAVYQIQWRSYQLGAGLWGKKTDLPTLPDSLSVSGHFFGSKNLSKGFLQWELSADSKGLQAANVQCLVRISEPLGIFNQWQLLPKGIPSFESGAYSLSSRAQNEQHTIHGINIDFNTRWSMRYLVSFGRYRSDLGGVFPTIKRQYHVSELQWQPHKKEYLLIRVIRSDRVVNPIRDYLNQQYVMPRMGARIEFVRSVNDAIGLKGRLESNWFSGQSGWLAMVECVNQKLGRKLDWRIRALYANIRDFNTRIYLYEFDGPGMSGFPAFHQTGIKLASMLSLKISRWAKVWVRTGLGKFPVSSGWQPEVSWAFRFSWH
ncbi:MAG TPA: helix-hairpin-helix domain-containing protein [Luteibaculaceae bacterium]|nr:helix-hairpin-helix domain-containing protein [Luteibaculaceae bacterium]